MWADGERKLLEPLVSPLACDASLTAGADPIGAGGGGGAVQVVIAEGCRWTATSAASWIAIVAGANGTGPGSVRFTVAPGRRISAVRALRGGQALRFGQRDTIVEFDIPSVVDYEVVALT